ncbi:MAG: 2-oxoacid:acceptor oxidoreductase family protein [Desulfarculus sp.]|nr:2-oxoacid:acceptor oxidoreductase family protein [Desulfarculus sp.]
MITEPREIMLAGLGGQGVILAGALLGQAAVASGLYAAGASSYGAQARGSLSRAELIIAMEPIDYPRVEAPDLLVAMCQEAHDAHAGLLAPGGRLLWDDGLVRPAPGGAGLGLPVALTARQELGAPLAANVLWVGVVAGVTNWWQTAALEEALAGALPARHLEVNRRALGRGLEMGRQARPEA